MTCPIVDAAGRVDAVFAGHKDDPDFMANVHDPAVAAMEDPHAKCSIGEAQTYHCHGNFASHHWTIPWRWPARAADFGERRHQHSGSVLSP